MIKVEDLNVSKGSATCLTQGVGYVKAEAIHNASIVIDLKANDVDIKTDGEKLSIVLKKKETAQEVSVQEQSKEIELKINDVVIAKITSLL